MRQLPRRFAILAGLGLIALAIVIFLVTRHHRPILPAGTGSGSGKAAWHAPIGPHLPGAPNDGTHLTGFVVDGAGLAVTGAEVSCELEKGGTDRALAPKPAAAHASPALPGGAAPPNGGAVSIASPALPGGAAPPNGGAVSIDDAGIAPNAGAGSATSTVAVAAPTGPDGHFVLDGLVPGRYRLRVSGPGLLAAEVRFVPVPSDEARIVVARQVGIDGTVTDGGKPVANATVGIRSEAIGGALEIKTDATGAFHVLKLPEGRYQVYAWQGALAARTVRVGRLGAGPFAPVELRLEAGEIVVGRVIDRGEGTGLVAAIELRPSGDDQAPRYTRSGDDGVFRIEGVPNGHWIADAYAPGYLSGGGVEIDAKSVPELALQRGAAIEGRVLDGGGKPIA
ncbi:MAG TPA: carboxypeptidase regulatory-like domain-containing protein, partial [Kofleriaceae bacterium]